MIIWKNKNDLNRTITLYSAYPISDISHKNEYLILVFGYKFVNVTPGIENISSAWLKFHSSYINAFFYAIGADKFMDCCRCNTGRDRDSNTYVHNRSLPSSNISFSCCERTSNRSCCDRNLHHMGASNATPIYGTIGNGKIKSHFIIL